MDIVEKLTEILGRKPELIQTKHHGKPGYFPLYFNYASRNDASKLFGNTKEETYNNWYNYLVQNGGQDATDTEHQREDGQED